MFGGMDVFLIIRFENFDMELYVFYECLKCEVCMIWFFKFILMKENDLLGV